MSDGHNQHWTNPETGQAECECCCGWALDYDKLRKINAEMYEALKLAKAEIVASGNWGARDYKWPEVCQKIDAAVRKADTQQGQERQ